MAPLISLNWSVLYRISEERHPLHDQNISTWLCLKWEQLQWYWRCKNTILLGVYFEFRTSVCAKCPLFLTCYKEENCELESRCLMCTTAIHLTAKITLKQYEAAPWGREWFQENTKVYSQSVPTFTGNIPDKHTKSAGLSPLSLLDCLKTTIDESRNSKSIVFIWEDSHFNIWK